jgi:2-dehydropantoate 2-reductase
MSQAQEQMHLLEDILCSICVCVLALHGLLHISMSAPWHVLGAGAVGCLWAARLARAAKVQPCLVLRSSTHAALGYPEHADMLVTETYHDTSVNWWKQPVQLQNTGTESNIQQLLVATKAHEAHAALLDIRHRLQDRAVVAVMCNGMGVLDEIAADTKLAGLRVLVGSSTHGSYRVCAETGR